MELKLTELNVLRERPASEAGPRTRKPKSTSRSACATWVLVVLGHDLSCPTYGDWLLGLGEVAATVLLVAGFGGFSAERLLFAPAGGVEVICGEAQTDQVFLDGVGAALAQSKIVFGGTAFVAMAFDGDAHVRIIFEEVGGLLQRFAGVGPNGRGVVIEVGVANFLEEEFIETGVWCGRHGSGHVDGNADGGIGAAACAAGRERVCGGLRGRDTGGPLRSDGADFRSDGDVCGVGGSPGKLDGFALIDGIAIGVDAGSGLYGRRGRSVGRRRRWRCFLVATSDEQNESRK
jgi:hypothetical protein